MGLLDQKKPPREDDLGEKYSEKVREGPTTFR